MKYLLDTNVISELKRPQPNSQVLTWFSKIDQEALYLSVLTLGEIYKGTEKLPDSQRKEKLYYWLHKEMPYWFDKRLLPVNLEIAYVWGELQAQMKRPLPAIDSLLAATALHYNLCLVTRNTKDFIYPNLKIINPWE